MRFTVILFFLGALFSACHEDQALSIEPGDRLLLLKLPAGFPEMPVPPENLLTEKRVALGRKLFYDPILSVDSSVSCGSCHFQELAFTDGKALSEGVQQRTGLRNAPPLFNLAWHGSFFRDGGVPTLEQQILVPIEDVNEMDFTVKGAVDRLNRHADYPQLFHEAYGREPDPFGLTRAIAAFERTMVSGNSPYDRFAFLNDEYALSEQQIAGMRLFNSQRLKCASCHSGFNLTNDKFENNGLYLTYADSGRARITLRAEDRGFFKVPSLRNIARTAPYMHDGSLNNLQEVLLHYESGGAQHVNQSDLVSGFSLSASEREAVIDFLHALTDSTFIRDVKFSNL